VSARHGAVMGALMSQQGSLGQEQLQQLVQDLVRRAVAEQIGDSDAVLEQQVADAVSKVIRRTEPARQPQEAKGLLWVSLVASLVAILLALVAGALALTAPTPAELAARVAQAIPTPLIPTPVPTLDPRQFKDPQLYTGVADFYGSVGNFESARYYWEQGVALGPQNPWALAGLGRSYFETGRYDDAIVWLERLAKENPGVAASSGAYYYLGASYQLKGQCAQALLYFRKALEQLPAGETGDSLKRQVEDGIRACGGR